MSIEEERMKIQNFTDLNAWKEAHSLYVAIHEASKLFPKDETFGLTSQVRRAALSVTSNIAEGFGRRSDVDKLHFYTMARGSLYEVQSQLLAARDTNIIKLEAFARLNKQSQLAQRILIGLINSTKERSK